LFRLGVLLAESSDDLLLGHRIGSRDGQADLFSELVEAAAPRERASLDLFELRARRGMTLSDAPELQISRRSQSLAHADDLLLRRPHRAVGRLDRDALRSHP